MKSVNVQCYLQTIYLEYENKNYFQENKTNFSLSQWIAEKRNRIIYDNIQYEMRKLGYLFYLQFKLQYD